MRMIVAIFQPTKLSAVRDALSDAGVKHMTVGDAMGYGRQHGRLPTFRGNEYKVDLLRKICLEIVVNEDVVDPAIEAIQRAALTGANGQIGDGKIFVLPVAQAIDIGGSAEGPSAL